MIAALVTGIVVFLLLGVPIYVSLALSSFISVVFFSNLPPMVLVQRFFGGMDTFALMALPFFILAANLMDTGGLSRRILKTARALVGHISGGMAMTTQLASMFFGALSGSAPSTVVAIGKVMYPELRGGGYDVSFSSGLLASAGSVSLIIPPSITFIIYASVTGVSVGKLFMSGLGAGIVYGGASLIYIYFYSKTRDIPRDKKVTRRELSASLRESAWALMIPVIILGGIYSGVFTPTEAAGISAVYAVAVGMFIYKELDMKGLVAACRATAVNCGQILVMVAGAQSLGWILTMGQAPQFVTTKVLLAIGSDSKLVFLALLNLILLVMGMFMEGVAAIIIVAPLIFPIIGRLGIDPVHLGTIMVSNLAIGMFTPPFGMNIFVTSSIARCDLVDMLPGLARFFLVDLAALLLITYVPQISLWIPSMF
ncbi:MAG: TRAP transporter large permease [Synergistaceae bacterium]|jgi:C4-dicarboxylate transporter DctM subunit|nr:TRAP transporter large permease [Synergistaceae bacterium]